MADPRTTVVLPPSRYNGPMARRKLNQAQIANLRALAAKMADEEGATAYDIAKAWNATHEEQFRLTPRAVLYHQRKTRDLVLSKAEDHVAAITDRLISRLASIALADPRAVATWEKDKIRVTDSSKLTESEAAQISMKITGRGENKALEISVDPNVRVRAARELLTFLHGTRISVTESGAIISRLTEAGDREGLERIAGGEDPVRVLIDRAPFLALPAEEADE